MGHASNCIIDIIIGPQWINVYFSWVILITCEIKLPTAVLCAVSDDEGDTAEFPLHYLAFIGDHLRMKISFTEHRMASEKQISQKDAKGRTPLHYAALTENLEGGEACVKAIVQFHQTLTQQTESEDELDPSLSKKLQRAKSIYANLKAKKDIKKSTKKFINEKDHYRETALSLAAKNENPKIVEYLLLNSANVLSTCGIAKKEQTLGLIYTHTPSAVTSVLDQSVTFDFGEKNYENVTTERKYVLDLSAIVGVPEKDENTNNVANFKEAELLHSVNDKHVSSRNKILKHPLVQLFVTKKSDKLRIVFWFSLLFHVIWVGLYIWLAIDVYCECCSCENINVSINTTYYKNFTCVRYPFENWNDYKNKNESEMDEINEIFKDSVKQKPGIYCRPIIIIFLSIVVLFKELYKIVFLRLNYFRFKNLFVWAFFVILVLTGWPDRTDVVQFIYQFQLTAFGIIISGQIIVHRVTKYTYLAIYIKVLLRQFQRFIAILPLFLIIMVSFATSLGMLFPDVNVQVSASSTHFRDAIMRIFEALTLAKVEWNEPYKESIDKNFPYSGLIMYLAFYIIIILLLYKILLGFVVADTKIIQDEEEVNSISDELESIFISESFLFSKTYECLSHHCHCFRRLRQYFMFCTLDESERDLKVKISEIDIPFQLRRDIRKLASKNLPTLTTPEKCMNDGVKVRKSWFQRLINKNKRISKV